jgi:hypothetical protein
MSQSFSEFPQNRSPESSVEKPNLPEEVKQQKDHEVVGGGNKADGKSASRS